MSNQELSIQTAGYEDLGTIRKLAVENAVVRKFSGRGVDEEEIKKIRALDLENVEQLLKKENVRIYKSCDSTGKIAGFLIIMLAFEHCVTGEFQAELNDIYVLPEFRRRGVGSALREKAERFVHSKGIKYVSAEVMAENAPALSFFAQAGYREEIKIMMMKDFSPKCAQYPEFRVRFARTFDFSRIKALAVDTIIYSKPPEREIDVEMLKELYSLRMYDPVEARRSKDAFYLVAETGNGEFAGFLLAEKERDLFCNAPQLKVVNIAVKEAFWGKKAAHALFNHLLKVAEDERIPYITGVIAAANRRSWLFFRRVWGALEERRQLGKRIVSTQER